MQPPCRHRRHTQRFMPRSPYLHSFLRLQTWNTGITFPASWKSITDYTTAKGLKLYGAVAAQLAKHIHTVYLAM